MNCCDLTSPVSWAPTLWLSESAAAVFLPLLLFFCRCCCLLSPPLHLSCPRHQFIYNKPYQSTRTTAQAISEQIKPCLLWAANADKHCWSRVAPLSRRHNSGRAPPAPHRTSTPAARITSGARTGRPSAWLPACCCCQVTWAECGATDIRPGVVAIVAAGSERQSRRRPPVAMCSANRVWAARTSIPPLPAGQLQCKLRDSQ